MAKKILLIDDDSDLVKIYSRKFRTKGLELVAASDGLEGLKKVNSEKPDLVLLDLLLPKLDGVMLFRKIRAQKETVNLPVILLTNVDDEKSITECFKLGAVDYLVKTEVTPEKVYRKVVDFLAEQEK